MNKALIGTIGLSLALLTACGGDTSEAPAPTVDADSSITTPNATPEDGAPTGTTEDEGDVNATPEEGDANATPEEGDANATPEEGDANATPPEENPNATPPEEEGQADDTAGDTAGGDVALDSALSETFAQAITASRDQELNDAYEIMTSFDHPAAEFIFPMIGLEASQVEAFAVSVSAMNTQAYGIAVVKPAAGEEAAVMAGLQGFIDLQISNFAEYLEDQKVVAESAVLETLDDGTILLVMGEGQDETASGIAAALA